MFNAKNRFLGLNLNVCILMYLKIQRWLIGDPVGLMEQVLLTDHQ